MEPNAGGNMYSNVQQPSMLGLEMSLNTPQTSHQLHSMVGFGSLEGGDYHPQQPVKLQPYPAVAKSKNQSLTLSDDEADNSGDDGKKKMSPWHRMKWTDNMVRLLIMVVYYIGDEAGSEGTDPKKKAGAGLLQKKGKWKSVSRAMMERGFYVSPQQCEDKFNDLNKRYKRVNDILGKGTACRVVENQSMLETMDHISPKMKDEVRKLLNSKHLFFREMCAYHNSCGHGGGGGGGGVHHSPPGAVAEGPGPSNQANKDRCLHSTTANARGIGGGSKLAKGISSDDDGDDDDDEDDDEEDEDDEVGGGGGSVVHQDEFNSMDGRRRKRARRVSSAVVEQLDGELASLIQDESKSLFEKSRWMKMKMMQLEESRVGILTKAFEIEKQRLKWLKFSSKKEREMEKEKLTNERLKLENERMVLLLKQKEMDAMDQQNQQQGNVIR